MADPSDADNFMARSESCFDLGYGAAPSPSPKMASEAIVIESSDEEGERLGADPEIKPEAELAAQEEDAGKLEAEGGGGKLFEGWASVRRLGSVRQFRR